MLRIPQSFSVGEKRPFVGEEKENLKSEYSGEGRARSACLTPGTGWLPDLSHSDLVRRHDIQSCGRLVNPTTDYHLGLFSP
jgi:hypothetical protein